MSKSVGTGRNRKANYESAGRVSKSKITITAKRPTVTETRIKGLIAGHGGLAKSVNSVNSDLLEKSKIAYKGLTKLEVDAKSKSISGILVHVTETAKSKNIVSNGGGHFVTEIIKGSHKVMAAKLSGASVIKATVRYRHKNGKISVKEMQLNL